jgi:hypothetical protein
MKQVPRRGIRQSVLDMRLPKDFDNITSPVLGNQTVPDIPPHLDLLTCVVTQY